MNQCCCIADDDGGGGPGPGDGPFWPGLPCNVPNCCADNNPTCPTVYLSRTKLISLGVPMTPVPPTTLCVEFEHPAIPCCKFRINWVNEPYGNQGIPAEGLPQGAIIDGITTAEIGQGTYPNCCYQSNTITESLTCIHADFVPFYDGSSEQDCEAYIAEVYDKVDQWGTVPGKELTMTNTMIYCVSTAGAAPGEPCEASCGVVLHNENPVINIQQVGLCVPIDQFASCPGQRTAATVTYLGCEACLPCGYCCDPENDPCEGVDPNDPFCEDPKATYSIRNCYSVVFSGDYQEETIFVASFPWCHSGIDPNANDRLAQAIDYYTQIISVTSTQYGNYPQFPHLLDGQLLSFCDLDFHILGVSTTGLVNRIKAKMPPGTTISQVATDCWWFGTRQTCQTCDPPYDQRGTFSEGDRLVDVQPSDISVGAGGVTVRVRGRSKKYHVCMSAELNALGPSNTDHNMAGGPVIIAQTSSTPLSPVEFCNVANYAFTVVEQDVTLTYICTKANPAEEVIACVAENGFPKASFPSRCGGFPYTKKGCRSYPFYYKVPCACDNQACPGACDGIYQNIGYYCETGASPIDLIKP